MSSYSLRGRPIVGVGLLSILAVVGVAPPVGAEPQRVTFQDAVRIALERNPALRRSENDLAVDKTVVFEAKSQFLPDLRLNAAVAENYGRSFSESEGRILSQRNQSVSARLASSLVLFNGFGRIATLKAANLDLEAGQRDTERTRQTVVFQVITGYLSVIESDAQHQVAEENLASQREQEDLVRKFVEAGRSPIADLYQQQANVARADLERVLTRRTLELARMDLVQILQLDPAGAYVFDAPVLPDSIDPGPEPVLSDLLTQAYERRADLKALEARLGSSEQEEKVAGAPRWPTLTLSGAYGSSYSSGSSERNLAQQFDDRRSGSVGLGLSFAIFDRFATSRGVRRAKLGTDNAEIALSDGRIAVALEVRRAVLDEQTARGGLKAARAEARAATQALEATQERYEAGASTLYEVTLSRAALVQAQSSVVSAAYALLWQKYVRDYYVGVLDPGTTLGP